MTEKSTLSSKEREQIIKLVTQANAQIAQQSGGSNGLQAAATFPTDDVCSARIAIGNKEHQVSNALHADFTLTKYKTGRSLLGATVRWMMKAEISLAGKQVEGYVVGKNTSAVWQEGLNAMAALKTGEGTALMSEEQAVEALQGF